MWDELGLCLKIKVVVKIESTSNARKSDGQRRKR